LLVGLSSENIPDGSYVGGLPNSYAIQAGYDYYWLSGKKHYFEGPNGAAIEPEWTGQGNDDVVGCGLLQSPEKGLAIFFTANGTLIGQFLRDSYKEGAKSELHGFLILFHIRIEHGRFIARIDLI
jgi:hypothetical protein